MSRYLRAVRQKARFRAGELVEVASSASRQGEGV